MTAEKYLSYRGDIKAAVGVGGTHPEEQAGGLYHLDADKLTLTVETLPKGGQALVADGETLWLTGERLAALVGLRMLILSRKDGKILQTLDLPETGTCLAVAPTDRWLARGTSKATVAVFDAEGKDVFLLSASGKLHEGAVSVILFEPDDLRFFSTGADFKLLSTHARGKLEPEDKGRSNNHADLVPALIWGPGERLYSGSRDGSIKSWPRTGSAGWSR